MIGVISGPPSLPVEIGPSARGADSLPGRVRSTWRKRLAMDGALLGALTRVFVTSVQRGGPTENFRLRRPLNGKYCWRRRSGWVLQLVPFRNGRGSVSTLRDGRVVQLSLSADAEATAPVKVGDLLRIELVDARSERVTVSALRGLRVHFYEFWQESASWIPQFIAVGAVIAVLFLTSLIVRTFLRSVEAGEILLASRGRNLHIFRGPCKALVVPAITQARLIPAQAINVDIEITDQTSDVDRSGRSAPVKVTVRASAIVSVGEDDSMVNTAANKFFSKPSSEQLSTLTDVLCSAGLRAINLLKHDQLFNRSGAVAPTTALPLPPRRRSPSRCAARTTSSLSSSRTRVRAGSWTQVFRSTASTSRPC
jgi:hypothetical protein